MDHRVKEMLDHLVDFVEKPHDAFNGMPVCPFARKARQSGKVKFFVRNLDRSLLPEAQLHVDGDVLTFVHPDKNISFEFVNELASWLESNLVGKSCFPGHPSDEFVVNGLYARREPYPNIQVVSTREIEMNRVSLKKTKYYEKRQNG